MARLSKLKLQQKAKCSSENKEKQQISRIVYCVCVPIANEDTKESKTQAKTVTRLCVFVLCGRIKYEACYAIENTCWIMVV